MTNASDIENGKWTGIGPRALLDPSVIKRGAKGPRGAKDVTKAKQALSQLPVVHKKSA